MINFRDGQICANSHNERFPFTRMTPALIGITVTGKGLSCKWQIAIPVRFGKRPRQVSGALFHAR
jgi:hypothetical protein